MTKANPVANNGRDNRGTSYHSHQNEILSNSQRINALAAHGNAGAQQQRVNSVGAVAPSSSKTIQAVTTSYERSGSQPSAMATSQLVKSMNIQKRKALALDQSTKANKSMNVDGGAVSSRGRKERPTKTM